MSHKSASCYFIQIFVDNAKRLSILEQEGKHFDSPESAKSIESFVKTYSLQLDELLEPDITKYKNFNEFFYRCALLPSSVAVTVLQRDSFC